MMMKKISLIVAGLVMAQKSEGCPTAVSMVEDVAHAIFEVNLDACSDLVDGVTTVFETCQCDGLDCLSCITDVDEFLADIKTPLDKCVLEGFCSSQSFSELSTGLQTCGKTISGFAEGLVDEVCPLLTNLPFDLPLEVNCSDTSGLLTEPCGMLGELLNNTKICEMNVSDAMDLIPIEHCPIVQVTPLPPLGSVETCPSVMSIGVDLFAMWTEFTTISECETLLDEVDTTIGPCLAEDAHPTCWMNLTTGGALMDLLPVAKSCGDRACKMEPLHSFFTNMDCPAGTGTFVLELLSECPLGFCANATKAVETFCAIPLLKPICDVPVQKVVDAAYTLIPSECKGANIIPPTRLSDKCPAMANVFRVVHGIEAAEGECGTFIDSIGDLVQECIMDPNAEDSCIPQKGITLFQTWSVGCRPGVCKQKVYYEPMGNLDTCTDKTLTEFIGAMIEPICKIPFQTALLGLEICSIIQPVTEGACEFLECAEPASTLGSFTSCAKANGGPGTPPPSGGPGGPGSVVTATPTASPSKSPSQSSSASAFSAAVLTTTVALVYSLI